VRITSAIAKNPWGVVPRYEAQRTDLWLLDLSGVCTALHLLLRSQGGTIGALANALPNANDAVFFGSSVVFPEQTVSSIVSKRDSRVYNSPAEDAALGAARITFITDADADGSAGRSRLGALLEAWRLVVRAGRGSVATGGQSLSLAEASATGSLIPDYAHNISVLLLRGISQDLAGDLVSGRSTLSNAASTAVLDVAEQRVLVRAWVSTIQSSDLRYTGGANSLEYQTSIFAEDIITVPLNTPVLNLH